MSNYSVNHPTCTISFLVQAKTPRKRCDRLLHSHLLSIIWTKTRGPTTRSLLPEALGLVSQPFPEMFCEVLQRDSRLIQSSGSKVLEPATGVKPAKKAIQRASVFETAGKTYRTLERFSISRSYSDSVLTPLRLQSVGSWVLNKEVTAHQTESLQW